MYKGKHTLSKARTHVTKPFALLVSLVLLAVGLTSTSLAFLIDHTPAVVNEFDPGEVTASITEDFDHSVKKDVSVQNTGNTDAYIRAKVVITWQDNKGNIYAQAPVADEDYEIEYTSSGEWFKGADGYWYCKAAVAPGKSTPVLINTCSPVSDSEPTDYHLVVEILADAIQSTPATAVQDAWGVTVGDNGTIQ